MPKNVGLCQEKEEALFQKSCPHCYSEKVKIHKKKVGVWKLSVFRPERKNDSGEFIPP